MSVAVVKEYLKAYELDDRVQEFTVSSATVELAAQALGVAPELIAKTLSFYLDDGCVLIVAAGDAKIDNRKFKDQFSCKAKMLVGEDVERLTGHAIGGVCPFANPEGTPVYLDRSLERFEIVYPAAGSSASAVKLSCEELMRASNAIAWIDVCKGWNEEA